MTKECTGCGEEKPEFDFYKKRSLCKSCYKQKRVKRTVELTDEIVSRISEEHSLWKPRLSDAEKEMVDELREGFSLLTSIQQRVMHLIVDEGYSLAETARLLNLTHQTISEHLGAARKKLLDYTLRNGPL